MHLRDRAVIGILALALVALSGAVIAPSLAPSGPGASPNASLPVTNPYVEGTVGTASAISPFAARTPVEREATALVFRGLVRLGPNDTLIGDLAERWEVDEAGASWTFHLRPGLVWQDGVPITAADVVFTVQALADPSYSGPGAASWREVRASAKDPLTVTLTLTTPLGGFLEATTQPIAPEHLLASIAPANLPTDPFGQRPVGSGAFRVASIDSSRILLLPSIPEPTDAAASEGPLSSTPPPTDSLATPAPTPPGGTPLPYLNGIEFRLFADRAELLTAWAAGDLDAVTGLPADEATTIAQAPDVTILRYPTTTLLGVILNLRPTHPEFADPNVRRALLQAIDRNAIVANALGGYASRAESLIPPTSWAFDAASSPEVATDVAAAEAALTTAGWTRADDGSWIPKGHTEPLVVELLSPTEEANPAAYAVADAVAADWTSFGLRTERTALPGAELVGGRLNNGDFSAAVVATGIGLDPDLYPLLASTQAGISGSNFSGIQDTALDALLVAARKPGSDADRMAAYAALQARLAAQAYVLPIAFPDTVVVVTNRFSGARIRALGGPGDRFWDVLTWRLADGR